MKVRFLILLALVAILAFDGGDSWSRRRRRRCPPTYTSQYRSVRKLYTALYTRHVSVLGKYKGLLAFVLREGRNAKRYGYQMKALGQKMIAKFYSYRKYAYGDMEFEDEPFIDESHDFDDDNISEQVNDDQDMFQDSEDFSENEDEEEVKQLPDEVQDTDSNVIESHEKE
uniref:uncharacterized protein LOC120341295 n=1 Tax=Styela clava TaxID=7725 RepID=UPI001939C2DE|nr:uncharacterized protein LOC120341295 [Styela clava]XP_039265719.1 uncharacterized protein LOC120341295 [Styela clava]